MCIIDKIIKDLESFSENDSRQACDYMFDDFPIIERHFNSVNEILDELDVTKLNSQLLYNIVWFTSNYINQLSNYRSFYKKVIAEAERRGYSEKKIVSLFENLENGGNCLYDPSAQKYKSPNEVEKEKLDNKIAWAKEFGDKDLLNYLIYYRDTRRRYEADEDKYHKMRNLLGDEEIRKRSIVALRALADKIESEGPHFIISADLPVVPIFGAENDDNDQYGAFIKIFLAPYPLGG
jgi:hypothetical protein